MTETTIVVVPREKYRIAVDTLDHLLAQGTAGADIVVVTEGRAPKRVLAALRARARDHGVRHLHVPRAAGANECRALGAGEATTPYVCFLDNDAVLHDGAREALVACAEETGAAFVAPLYLMPDGAIHYAGGYARIEQSDDGRRRLVERHTAKGPVDGRRADLHREPTDAPELHGVLVRTASLAAAGGLDPQLESSMDCLDLALRLQDLPGGGWFEPAASVTYDNARPRLSDLPLFFSRWSRLTVAHDLERFRQEWRLEEGDERIENHRLVCGLRRWRPFRPVRGPLRRLVGNRGIRFFDRALDPLIDHWATPEARRSR